VHSIARWLPAPTPLAEARIAGMDAQGAPIGTVILSVGGKVFASSGPEGSCLRRTLAGLSPTPTKAMQGVQGGG